MDRWDEYCEKEAGRLIEELKHLGSRGNAYTEEERKLSRTALGRLSILLGLMNRPRMVQLAALGRRSLKPTKDEKRRKILFLLTKKLLTRLETQLHAPELRSSGEEETQSDRIIHAFEDHGLSIPAGEIPLSQSLEKTGEIALKLPEATEIPEDRTLWLGTLAIRHLGNRPRFVKKLRKALDSGEIIRYGLLTTTPPRTSPETEPLYYFVFSTLDLPGDYLSRSDLPIRMVKILRPRICGPFEPRDQPGLKPDSEPILEISGSPETEEPVPPEFPAEDQEQRDSAGEGFNEVTTSGQTAPSKKVLRKEARRQKKEAHADRVRISIGIKLGIILSLLLIFSLSGMIYAASYFFLADSRIRVEESNLQISEIISQQITQSLETTTAGGFLLFLGAGTGESEEAKNFIKYYFRNNSQILYTGLPEQNRSFYNEETLYDLNVSQTFIDGVISDHLSKITQAKVGSAVVFNLSTYFNTPVIGLAVPYKLDRGTQALTILFSAADLQDAVQSRGITESFVVTGEGALLAHPDPALVTSGADLATLPVVRQMFESPTKNGQIRYTNGEDEAILGSYKKISFGQLGVITTIPEALAFEEVYNIQRRNIYLMLGVLSLSLLMVYFYSKTLTIPMRRLVGATQKIESGDYELSFRKRSRDEINVLNRAFIHMGQGLAEKERIKDAFGRFVNKEVADLAAQGEIQLGGESKTATVFFSDIRSFTAISEKLTPAEVVEFLNEYMTLMVDCVETHKGVVDKFIGDAIMALWGTPISHGNDTENAIDSALEMRRLLRRFNADRGGEKHPIIRIGCGINTGTLLAGQIGSSNRMEYTVIGDTVNLASRIEALNKPMGTDILITQQTAEIVEGIYHTIPMNKIKVKGKEEPQQIYAVLGRLDDPDRPKNLKELRELTNTEGNFDTIVDAEQEEVKYEIID